MVLSKALAAVLLRFSKGEKIPASKFKNPLAAELLAEGVLIDIRSGRTKSTLYAPNASSLAAFLLNHFSISDLDYYINTLSQETISRADLVKAASNSKIKKVRTFTGFLVNCYSPVLATLNGRDIIIDPPTGTFQFIYDFKNFVPNPDVTVVGVENAENFSHIHQQTAFFKNINPLFVCRYPLNQSKDLIKWLQSIPNSYLHFGDFDFAGIGIYINEYKRYLGDKSAFYIPDEIESYIKKWGNRTLYNNQKINYDLQSVKESKIHQLIAVIHKHKKALEQEILIR